MFSTGRWLAILLVSAAGTGSDVEADGPLATLAEIPEVDRVAEDFYGALANGSDRVAVTWSVHPEVIPLDGMASLRLRIEPVANPGGVRQPNLHEFPEFQRLFHIEATASERPGPGIIEFLYQLRPRQLGTLAIPTLKFRYYRPGFPEGRRFQTAYARSIPLTVTPAEKSIEKPIIIAPPSFFQIVSESPSVIAIGNWTWLIPLGVTPPAVAVGLALIRRFFPHASRFAGIRQNQAAHIALTALAKAAHDTAPATAVATAITEYLRTRIPLPGNPTTTEEWLAALATTDWPEARQAEVAALLHRCDAARYSGESVDIMSLAAFAEQQIRAWETS